jgi:hemerythrin superfamily protein
MEEKLASREIDAVTLLKADHRKVEELFEQFQKARRADTKRELVQKICTELTIHTLIEEEIFYPACKGQIEDDTVLEAFVEHDGAKMLMAEIEAGSPEDEFYDAKVTVLSEDIKHHVKEEERRGDGMFAQAKRAGLDLDALGARLLERKKALLEKFTAEGLPPPVTRTVRGPVPKKGPLPKFASR